MVTLGFDYTNLEKPQWNAAQGLQQAERICKGWGYKSASWLVNDQKCNYLSHSRHHIGDMLLDTDECTAARLMAKYQCTSQSNEIATKPAQSNFNNLPSAVSQASAYQSEPTTQSSPVQPVVEEQAVPTYQQTQPGQYETDLRHCLSLIDNKAIAKCVQKAKR